MHDDNQRQLLLFGAAGAGCMAVLLVVGLIFALLLLPFIAALALVHAFSPRDPPPQYPVPRQLAAYYGQVADGYAVFWEDLAAWDGAQYHFNLPIPSEEQIFAQLFNAALQQRRQDCSRKPPDQRKENPLCNPPHLTPEEIAALRREAHRRWVRNLLDHIEQHARNLQDQGAIRDDDHEDRAVDWAALVGSDLADTASSLALGYTTEEAMEDSPDLLHPANTSDADFVPEGTFAWPVQSQIVTHFGYRYLGSPPRWRLHPGVDLTVPIGTQVCASRGGRVLKAAADPTYGSLVVVDHGDGYTTWYAHLGPLHVSEGAFVGQGQVLADPSGDKPVHFEVRFQDLPRNPLLFLP